MISQVFQCIGCSRGKLHSEVCSRVELHDIGCMYSRTQLHDIGCMYSRTPLHDIGCMYSRTPLQDIGCIAAPRYRTLDV